MVQIRNYSKLSLEDQTAALKAAVIDLDLRFFPFPWSKEAWHPVLDLTTSSEQILYLLFDDAADLVGFSLFDTNFADSFAHLLKILVHPDKRGEGLGRALLGHAIEDLKNQGVKNFFLEVEEDNSNAISTYEAHGFKGVHKKKGYYSNNKTALVMTRND